MCIRDSPQGEAKQDIGGASRPRLRQRPPRSSLIRRGAVSAPPRAGQGPDVSRAARSWAQESYVAAGSVPIAHEYHPVCCSHSSERAAARARERGLRGGAREARRGRVKAPERHPRLFIQNAAPEARRPPRRARGRRGRERSHRWPGVARLVPPRARPRQGPRRRRRRRRLRRQLLRRDGVHLDLIRHGRLPRLQRRRPGVEPRRRAAEAGDALGTRAELGRELGDTRAHLEQELAAARRRGATVTARARPALSTALTSAPALISCSRLLLPRARYGFFHGGASRVE